MTASGRGVALGRFALWSATRRGLRDRAMVDALQVPLRSIDPADPSRALLPLVTPYVSEVAATSARAVQKLRAKLIRRERKLIQLIHGEAVQVVACYDVSGAHMPAALARFGGWAGTWRTTADQCRCRAEVIVERSNRQLSRYWAGVCRDDAPPGRHPALYWSAPTPLSLDPSWLHPDTWLFAALDGEGPGVPSLPGSKVTARALAILFEQDSRSHGRKAS